MSSTPSLFVLYLRCNYSVYTYYLHKYGGGYKMTENKHTMETGNEQPPKTRDEGATQPPEEGALPPIFGPADIQPTTPQPEETQDPGLGGPPINEGIPTDVPGMPPLVNEGVAPEPGEERTDL